MRRKDYSALSFSGSVKKKPSYLLCWKK